MLIDKNIGPTQKEIGHPDSVRAQENKTLCCCVDYCNLNDITKRDSLLIPCMDECTDLISDAALFPTLDADSGYWQIETDQTDSKKTAITSHHGLYHFIRMPFVLSNVPGTLHSTMDVALSTGKWQFALVYLEDIVKFSKNLDEHIDHVRHVLPFPSNGSETVELKKCKLFTDAIEYLGKVIRKTCLETT